MPVKRTLVLTLAVAAFSVATRATTIVKRSFDDLCDRAQIVFCGTAATVESRRDEGPTPTGTIHTYTTFEGIEWIQGGGTPPAGSTYTVRTLGGTAAGESLIVHGMPRFEVGRRYVLFIRGNQHVACPLVGWRQGCFRVVDNGSEAAPHVETFDGRRVISISNDVVTARPDRDTRSHRVTVMTLDRFLERVREGLARAADRRNGVERP